MKKEAFFELEEIKARYLVQLMEIDFKDKSDYKKAKEVLENAITSAYHKSEEEKK